jgi:flagellar biosynthesis/type III secretory pathway chaperone
MASNELAELGRKLQELTTRVASLEAAAALDAPQREQLSRRWAEIEALTRRARTSARKIGSLAGIRRQLAELTKFRNALLMRQVVTRSRRLNRKARKSGKVKA